MSFLKSIFGGEKVQAPQIPTITPGINAGGLSASVNPSGNAAVNSSPIREGAVSDVANNFGALGDITGTLRDTVGPGFNDLLKAQLASYNNDAAASIGSLAKNLQSRRVLGSSFGQDTLTRANNLNAMNRSSLIANNFLQSLQTNNALLKQQYDAYNQKYQTNLNELNLQANLATQLSTAGSQILSQNAQTQAKLGEDASKSNVSNDINLATGFGKLVGSLALAPFTGGLSLGGLGALPTTNSAAYVGPVGQTSVVGPAAP